LTGIFGGSWGCVQGAEEASGGWEKVLGGLMKRVFRNSVVQFLLSYLVTLAFALSVVGFGFQVAFRIVEENLKVTHVNMLQRSADTIESQLVAIESMALQIANDENILEMASMDQGGDDYVLPAMRALERYALYLNYQSIELLNSRKAYIYFRKSDRVMFEKSYYRPETFRSYLDSWDVDYQMWREFMVEDSCGVPEFRYMGDGFEYVFPFSTHLFGEKEGVIVFRIDGDAICRQMLFTSGTKDNVAYLAEILDEDGNMLWISDPQQKFPQLSPDDLENGYVEKEGLSILTVQSPKLRGYYVLALPVKESLSELSALKNTVLLLALTAIGGGIVISLIQSLKRGKPVDEALRALSGEGEEPENYTNLGTAVSEVVKRHKDVLAEVEKNKVSLQKGFFSDLLKAEFDNESQLKAAAQKAGVDIDNQVYQIVYIQLFAGNDFNSVDEQTMNDVRVLFQMTKKCLREFCGEMVWFYKRNFSSLAAIFAIDSMEEDVIDVVSRAKEWLQRECQVEASWGIGGTCCDLLLIWRAMEEAGIALENCTQSSPVVCYSPELADSGEYYLPVIAEEKLKSCLRSGQWQETKEILALLESENCVNRHLRRAQFIKLSQKLMDVLEGDGRKKGLTEKALWLGEVLMQPELVQSEYFQRLRQICRTICNDNVAIKQEQRSRMVEEIKEYIQNHYCEPDMGLARVGGEFRVSESYLSTIFKEQSGGNFGDFLEKLRIEKACELLQDRKRTVNEVAEEVGYNSAQSFRRAFKRVKGVSPKEVRER